MPIAGQQTTPAPAAGTPPKIVRKGRIKQGLWRTTFGADSKLSFDDMCREAVRLGCYGFDLVDPADWPTLRKHGLEPLIAGAGPVTFENGVSHAEVHDELEKAIRPFIDMCARERIRTFISIGGQRRGMPYAQGADNAVAFLNRIKGQLEERNVTIAIENMNNRRLDPRFGREDQIFGHWDWGVDVCERVNSKNVKLVCDLYHLQIMDGDIAQTRPRLDSVDRALPHRGGADAQRDRLHAGDELPLHRRGDRRATVQRLREPRMAPGTRPRSDAQHRRSIQHHGRLSAGSCQLDPAITNRNFRRIRMNTPARRSWPRTALAAFAAATLLTSLANAAPPALPEGYISGVVTSSRGPEAGVWVIAETKELQTPFVKIVVTGDDGRYVLPQLPTATYNVWVRGYGLADSDRVEGRPGDTALDLTAKLAATPAEAAKVYPGNYWLSLLQPPAPSEFPGTGASGNGIPPDLKVQGQWINNIKSQCNFCHQLGGAVDALARPHGPPRLQDARGRVDLSHAARRARQRDGRRVRGVRRAGRREGVRGLDDTHRERRIAAATAAARRRGAQRRRHAVGLGQSTVVHARRDFDRQERSNRERLRSGVRGLRRPRPNHGHRSDREQHARNHDPDARGPAQGHFAVSASRDAFQLLGHGARLGSRESRRSPQPDDGPQGPAVDDLEDPQR